MENQKETLSQSKFKRASLLGLPAELRVRIYRELFRIQTWEAHQARKDIASPEERLREQCPVCHCYLKDGNYLYPTCWLICKNDELILAPPCCSPSSPSERTNRCAILRACRTTYREAVDYLYTNTPFMILLGECYPGDQRVDGPFKLKSEWKALLSRVPNLCMRVHTKEQTDIGRLKVQILEVMDSVWRDREHAKIHLRTLNRRDRVTAEGISLTTRDDLPTHPPFRMVLYGVSYLVSPDEWHLFLLKLLLPARLLDQVNKFLPTDYDMEPIADLNKFLMAVHKVQGCSFAGEGDVHVA